MKEIDEALKLLGKSAKVGSAIQPVEVMPTESKALNDDILACGGLPRGRVVELYAKASVGKSTLAQWLAGQVQKQTFTLQFGEETVTRQGMVCWFDAEGSMARDYAASSGMDMDRVIIPDFSFGEDLLHRLKLAIASDMFDLIVLDSIQAVIPEELSDLAVSRSMNQRLAPAKMWAQFFNELQGGYQIKDPSGSTIFSRKTEYVINEKGKEEASLEIHKMHSKKACLLLINHQRTKISTGFSRGPKTYTPGGDEKDFAFSVRLEMALIANKRGKVKGERILKYREVKISAKKNKLGIPLRERSFFFGVDGTLMLDEDDIEVMDTKEVPVDDDEDTEDVETQKMTFDTLKSRVRQAMEEEDDG